MRCPRLSIVMLVAAIASGCDARSLAWRFRIADGLEPATIEARVIEGGCGDGAVRYQTRFDRGASAMEPPALDPGPYGFEIVARDAQCRIVGTGCVDVTLPADEVVVAVAASTPGAACDPGAICVDGRCEEDSGDAGIEMPDGSTVECDCEEPTDVCDAGRCLPIVQASELAMGRSFGCALATVRATGASQVYCWGDGPVGQLGVGCVATSADPVSVAPTEASAPGWSAEVWTDIESSNHTCIVSESGRIFCWGASSNNQAGFSETCSTNQPSPFEIGVGTEWADVAVGDTTTCAITSDGERHCFGRADQGRIGNGMTGGSDLATPTRVDDGLRWSSLEGGTNGNFYGRITSGEVYFYGWNDAGQTLPTGASTTSPLRLGLGLEAFGLGQGYGCQIETGGSLSCWGCSALRAGDYPGCQLGALGIGEGGLDPDPIDGYPGTMARLQVVDSGARSVGAYDATCAIIDGRLSCWGPHENGILGFATVPAACGMRTIDGAPRPYCATPQPVDSSATDWLDVDVGGTQACAIRDGGRLYCWGLPAGAGSGPAITSPARMSLR